MPNPSDNLTNNPAKDPDARPNRIDLAKPALDVGLATNQLDAMLAFWQDQAQVAFSEMLPLGGGARQHRHAIGDSVLKINHNRNPLPASTPSGLAKLEIFSAVVDEPCELLDPDGNEVLLRPVKDTSEDPVNLRLHLAVNDLAQSQNFYRDVLGLTSITDARFKVGASQIELHRADPQITTPVERGAIGYRYMTVQVFDVVKEHGRIMANGGVEGMPPTRLGEVAYISFVRDPDGNWIEISQRKSITGSLD